MWVFLEVLLDLQRSCTWSGKVSSCLMDVVPSCSCLTAPDRNSPSNSGLTCTIVFHTSSSVNTPTHPWHRPLVQQLDVTLSYFFLLILSTIRNPLSNYATLCLVSFFILCFLYVALPLMNPLSKFSWPLCVIKMFCLPSWMWCLLVGRHKWLITGVLSSRLSKLLF